MFTGIVEEVGRIRSLKKFGDSVEIVILAKKTLSGLAIDNSICVNGVCLTVVRRTKTDFTIQAIKETLGKTNLVQLKKDSFVNLERSVKLIDRLGGHIVQGHVDTTGVIEKIKNLQTSWIYTVSFPKAFKKYLISVGSITVDGTSLTVAKLGKDKFTVAIIPFTYQQTIFNHYKKGDRVNLEFDILGKYLESLVHFS